MPLRSDFDDAPDLQQMECHPGRLEGVDRLSVIDLDETKRVIMHAFMIQVWFRNVTFAAGASRHGNRKP